MMLLRRFDRAATRLLFRAFSILWPKSFMKNYDFADKFRALYDKAVKLYPSGQTDASTYFNAEETAFLAANRHQRSGHV